MSFLQLSIRLVLSLTLLGLLAWGSVALHYQLSGWLQKCWIALWCLAGLITLVLLWRQRLSVGGLALALLWALLLVWWNSFQPSNDRQWAADVAHITHGEVIGDELLLNNVRNFNWRSDEDFDVHWENRRYNLNELESVDLLTSYWGMPAIAHVMVSFGFKDGQQLLFTVEIRKKQGQQYSEIGGFFKQFELSIVATDERDAVRVRTNVRGEDVYLYRINMSHQAMRQLLLAYVEQANQLKQEPRFYNTITANCTTIVFAMVQHIIGGLPMDYRLILSGYLPEYVNAIGGLQAGFSLEQLRSAGRITDRAKAADQDPDFSAKIRHGVPGYNP